MLAERRARAKPLIRTAAAVQPSTAGGDGGVPCRLDHPDAAVQLQQLAALNRAGVLTDAEFAAARQRLLGQ